LSADDDRLDSVNGIATSLVAACVGPALLLAAILTPPALGLWLGADFSENSTLLSRIFLVGFFCLAINALTMASLSARGIVGRVAVMHLIEAPIYLWCLDHFGSRLGLEGLALVWAGRMIVEFVAYSVMQSRAAARPGQSLGTSVVALTHCLPLIAVAVFASPLQAIGAALAACALSFALVRRLMKQS
jgi:O-antigen/teichoic acid export membrane protein